MGQGCTQKVDIYSFGEPPGAVLHSVPCWALQPAAAARRPARGGPDAPFRRPALDAPAQRTALPRPCPAPSRRRPVGTGHPGGAAARPRAAAAAQPRLPARAQPAHRRLPAAGARGAAHGAGGAGAPARDALRPRARPREPADPPRPFSLLPLFPPLGPGLFAPRSSGFLSQRAYRPHARLHSRTSVLFSPAHHCYAGARAAAPSAGAPADALVCSHRHSPGPAGATARPARRRTRFDVVGFTSLPFSACPFLHEWAIPQRQTNLSSLPPS